MTYRIDCCKPEVSISFQFWDLSVQPASQPTSQTESISAFCIYKNALKIKNPPLFLPLPKNHRWSENFFNSQKWLHIHRLLDYQVKISGRSDHHGLQNLSSNPTANFSESDNKFWQCFYDDKASTFHFLKVLIRVYTFLNLRLCSRVNFLQSVSRPDF
jgi:hypothetical protein